MPSDYDFPKIKSFRKKVGLPSLNKWRVSAEDTLIAGRIPTVVKNKGFFCDATSSMKHRETIVTKQGYMIIYFAEEKGYVVDIPDAVKVTTCTTTLRSKEGGITTILKRTQLGMKFRFGSVSLFVIGKEALSWIEAINRLAFPAGKDFNNQENRLSCQFDTLPLGKPRSSRDYSIVSDNSVTIASPLPSVKKLLTPKEDGAKGLALSLKQLDIRKSPLLTKKLGPVLKAKAKLTAKKKVNQENQSVPKEIGGENKRRNTIDSVDGREAGEQRLPGERKSSGPAATSEEKINRI